MATKWINVLYITPTIKHHNQTLNINVKEISSTLIKTLLQKLRSALKNLNLVNR